MVTVEIMQRIEQVSEVLACAQDYDVFVLADLHRWFNHLFRQSCRSTKMETAAMSAAAARIVERMLIGLIRQGLERDARKERQDHEQIKMLLVSEMDRTLNGKCTMLHGGTIEERMPKYAQKCVGTGV